MVVLVLCKCIVDMYQHRCKDMIAGRPKLLAMSLIFQVPIAFPTYCTEYHTYNHDFLFLVRVIV